MNEKNPWTRARFEEYLGREESSRLDFKQSDDLIGPDNKKTDFLNDLSHAVSAFLNSEGGLLLIGIEEERTSGRKDIAARIQGGVPRSDMSADRLARMIIDRISPATADLVRVFPITVGQSADSQPLLAFAVEVRQGMTAYQAQDDKKYYIRADRSSVAMHDRDIRLRMLAPQAPRVQVAASFNVEAFKRRLEQGGRYAGVYQLPLDVTVRNIGFVTIREFVLQYAFLPENEYSKGVVTLVTPTYPGPSCRYRWPSSDDSDGADVLFPDDVIQLRIVHEASRDWHPTQLHVSLDTQVFLDNGPSVSTRIDLRDTMAECLNAIAAPNSQ